MGQALTPFKFNLSELLAEFSKDPTVDFLCKSIYAMMAKSENHKQLETTSSGTMIAFCAAYPEIFEITEKNRYCNSINGWIRQDQSWVRYNVVDMVSVEIEPHYNRRFRRALLQYLINEFGDRELSVKMFWNFSEHDMIHVE